MSEARHPLQTLIGGPRGAIEGMAPPIVFVLAYAMSGSELAWAIGAALAVGFVLAVWRLMRGERPVRVIGALFVVALGALIAAYTGSAVAYFWPLVLANVVSALAFAVSILIRWPLLGVIVGPIAGTRMRWRSDPDLLRAYSRASWLWVALNLIRAAVQVPLIEGENLWALAAVRPVFYLLVLATIWLSWVVIRRTLPADHPGIRTVRSIQAD